MGFTIKVGTSVLILPLSGVYTFSRIYDGPNRKTYAYYTKNRTCDDNCCSHLINPELKFLP